jgi:hypothetical protein
MLTNSEQLKVANETWDDLGSDGRYTWRGKQIQVDDWVHHRGGAYTNIYI